METQAEKQTTKPQTIPIGLVRLKEYIRLNWTPTAVALHIQHVFMGSPIICPPYILWAVPNTIDIPTIIHAYMTRDDYLEDIWPSLSILLTNSITNLPWAASVATSIALFDVIRLLPVMLENRGKDK